MNKTALWIVITGTIVFCCGVGTIIYNNYKLQNEVENLNAQMVFVVKKYNKLNHAHNKLKNEMQGYKDANEQLITHCRPCDVNKAIKATPMPALIKVK